MDKEKSSKKLITHNGSFHADDIFAAAALSIYLEAKGQDFEIIRTRDMEVIKTGDYVFDVGGIYNEEKNLFDHHQKEGAGKNPYGIEYSSLGLVWKKFGVEIAGSEKAAKILEKRLCAPVDAWDNGQDLVESRHEVAPYYVQNIFFAMMPTWKEAELHIDDVFLECVALAKNIWKREIIQAAHMAEAEAEVIAAYEQATNKSIIVLDKSYPFEHTLINFPEPLYVVYPRKMGDWGVKAVRKSPKSFESRKNLPASWGGLQDAELAKVSGVPDAVFCHRALFTAAAKTKEGAVKLAQIAAEL
ncbi:MAG: MYG1 family protein [bacterium]|nr:MYG1 family protein [bacterium]